MPSLILHDPSEATNCSDSMSYFCLEPGCVSAPFKSCEELEVHILSSQKENPASQRNVLDPFERLERYVQFLELFGCDARDGPERERYIHQARAPSDTNGTGVTGLSGDTKMSGVSATVGVLEVGQQFSNMLSPIKRLDVCPVDATKLEEPKSGAVRRCDGRHARGPAEDSSWMRARVPQQNSFQARANVQLMSQ